MSFVFRNRLVTILEEDREYCYCAYCHLEVDFPKAIVWNYCGFCSRSCLFTFALVVNYRGRLFPQSGPKEKVILPPTDVQQQQ
jgi:hypothetical protein